MKNAWMRSDSLVTGWILGSLSEEVAMEVVNCLTSKHNNTDFTAKDAWDELQRRYGPSEAEAEATVNSPTEISNIVDEEEEEETKTKEAEAQSSYGPSVATVLHVAVRYSRRKHLLQLLKDDPESSENTLLDLVNSDGSNLLHVAAFFGNNEAARILLDQKSDLILAEDKDGHTPLALSLSNMHTKTSEYLIDHIKNDEEKKDKLFSGESGDDLLVLAISSKEFCLAHELLTHYRTIHSEAVLMAIAQNFPSEVHFWGGMIRYKENITYRTLDVYFRRIGLRGCCCLEAIPNFFLRGITRILLCFHLCFLFCFWVTLSFIVWPFIKKRVGVLNNASDLLHGVCEKIYETTDRSHCYYLNPVFEATRQNASEVVAKIVSRFPNAIKFHNEDGHDFFQYAVINRSERIYNMLFETREEFIVKNINKTIKDSSENNLLHFAAKLAPSNKLELISGGQLYKYNGNSNGIRKCKDS